MGKRFGIDSKKLQITLEELLELYKIHKQTGPWFCPKRY